MAAASPLSTIVGGLLRSLRQEAPRLIALTLALEAGAAAIGMVFLLLDWAAMVDGFTAAASFVLVSVTTLWIGTLLALAGSVERLDEARTGIWARLIPLRRHSWFAVLWSWLVSGVTTGVISFLFIMGLADILPGEDGTILLGGGLVGATTLAVHWVHRRIYRLPRSWRQAFIDGGALGAAAGLLALGCGLVGAVLLAIYESLPSPSGGSDWLTFLLVLGAALPLAVLYAALTLSVAVLLHAMLLLRQRHPVPLMERYRGVTLDQAADAFG